MTYYNTASTRYHGNHVPVGWGSTVAMVWRQVDGGMLASVQGGKTVPPDADLRALGCLKLETAGAGADLLHQHAPRAGFT